MSLTKKILNHMRMLNRQATIEEVYEAMQKVTGETINPKSIRDLLGRLTRLGHLKHHKHTKFCIKSQGPMVTSIQTILDRFEHLHDKYGNIPVYLDDKLHIRETDGFISIGSK